MQSLPDDSSAVTRVVVFNIPDGSLPPANDPAGINAVRGQFIDEARKQSIAPPAVTVPAEGESSMELDVTVDGETVMLTLNPVGLEDDLARVYTVWGWAGIQAVHVADLRKRATLREALAEATRRGRDPTATDRLGLTSNDPRLDTSRDVSGTPVNPADFGTLGVLQSSDENYASALEGVQCAQIELAEWERLFDEAFESFAIAVIETLERFESTIIARAVVQLNESRNALATMFTRYGADQETLEIVLEDGTITQVPLYILRNVAERDALFAQVQRLNQALGALDTLNAELNAIKKATTTQSGAGGGTGGSSGAEGGSGTLPPRTVEEVARERDTALITYQSAVLSAHSTHPYALILSRTIKPEVEVGIFMRAASSLLYRLLALIEAQSLTPIVPALFPNGVVPLAALFRQGPEETVAIAALHGQAFIPVGEETLLVPTIEKTDSDPFTRLVAVEYLGALNAISTRELDLKQTEKALASSFGTGVSILTFATFVFPPLAVLAVPLAVATVGLALYQAASIATSLLNAQSSFDAAVVDALTTTSLTADAELVALGELLTSEPGAADYLLGAGAIGLSLVSAVSLLRALPRAEITRLDALFSAGSLAGEVL